MTKVKINIVKEYNIPDAKLLKLSNNHDGRESTWIGVSNQPDEAESLEDKPNANLTLKEAADTLAVPERFMLRALKKE
ncbi:MAG: hypothetical protein KC766_42345 [Myxococcales bacterium]|nr:hypothetical protein [Myxococcales bacterium]